MLVLNIKAPPFSINKAHYRNGKRTVACRKWGELVLNQLDQYQDELASLSSFIKNNLNTTNLQVEIFFFIPENLLFTKDGKMSRRAQDLSNVEKMLIDLLFDPRFTERGYNNLNLDDALISSLHSHKRLSKNKSHYIKIIINSQSNSLL